jgi:hypothetical protein
MNYAVVILAFVFLMSVAYWVIHGQYYYTGPRTQAQVVNGRIVSAEAPVLGTGDEEQGTKETIVLCRGRNAQ